MMLYALAKLEPFKNEVQTLFGIDLVTHPEVKYMTLDEAKTILREHGVMSLGKDTDLPDEGEKMLYEILKTELIFISEYPIAKRPFYHLWEREKGTTKSFDLIFKGIEITSGAIRQHNYEIVKKQAVEKGLNLESIKTYLDNFKYGCAPHGGFGVGVERVISRLLGITVKESSFMPRDPERLLP